MKVKWANIFSIFFVTICIIGCSKQENSNLYLDNLLDKKNLVASDHYYFNYLNWKEKLTFTEEKSIHQTINTTTSRYSQMEVNMMEPSLIHRIYSIEKLDTLFYWENYRKYFSETKTMTDEEYDNFLYVNIKPEELQINVNIHSAHYGSSSDVLLNALVVRKSKLLRKQKTSSIELPDSILNYHQKQLLKYSQLTNSKAIDTLILDISNYNEKLKNRASELVLILRTYDNTATRKILRIVRDTTNLNRITKDGKDYLLNYLAMKIQLDLTIEEQNEFMNYLNHPKIYDGILIGQKKWIALITHLISKEDLELCQNNIGLY